MPAGSRFADICCDHAKLAIELSRAGRVASAIAVDIAAAPLALAKKNAARTGVDVDVRQADGLAGLRPLECTCIALAGIGGAVAVEILAPARLEELEVERIVVQVNKKLPELRRHLYAHGWRTAAETVVRSGRRLFVTSAFERGEFSAGPVDLLIGPYLRAEKSVEADELIAGQLAWLERLEGATEKLPPISVGVTSEMLRQLQLCRSRDGES